MGTCLPASVSCNFGSGLEPGLLTAASAGISRISGAFIDAFDVDTVAGGLDGPETDEVLGSLDLGLESTGTCLNGNERNDFNTYM